jgi:hypothetical protein
MSLLSDDRNGTGVNQEQFKQGTVDFIDSCHSEMVVSLDDGNTIALSSLHYFPVGNNFAATRAAKRQVAVCFCDIVR